MGGGGGPRQQTSVPSRLAAREHVPARLLRPLSLAANLLCLALAPALAGHVRWVGVGGGVFGGPVGGGSRWGEMAKAAQELMKNYVKPEKLTELASRWGVAKGSGSDAGLGGRVGMRACACVGRDGTWGVRGCAGGRGCYRRGGAGCLCRGGAGVAVEWA